MLPSLSLAINKIKDGYLWLIGAIEAHPHITLLTASGLIILAAVA